MFSTQRRMFTFGEGMISNLLYFKDLVDEYIEKLGFVGVQQLIVVGPSEKYYEIEDGVGNRYLLYLVSDKFNIINIYVVEECDLVVSVPNIVHHSETCAVVASAASDGNSTENEGEDDDEIDLEELDSNFEQIGCFLAQRKQEVTEHLIEYKEIHSGMSFKDIAESRKFYAMVSKKELVLLKSDNNRLRYGCEEGCQFICLISKDKCKEGCRVKILNTKRDCTDKFDNSRVDYLTSTHYFKRKLQDDPKYKVKEMRNDLQATFNLNATHGKCTRAKRMILEKLEGSFNDDYNKL
ncbi:uncharacterized protein LOC132054800 [Lycium ferocissimum]|uniref:uncharacterized protein LOC132054800 n=1 Tax=Lycium ferocissimum TaxID=112874 RepID=UPI002815B3DC|nr:uncharacterized protein LOC132054800 [Lycium ferocissimum]